jgi:hypothetical protein
VKTKQVISPVAPATGVEKGHQMNAISYCLSVLKLDPGSEKLSMQSSLKGCGVNVGTISRALAGQASSHR